MNFISKKEKKTKTKSEKSSSTLLLFLILFAILGIMLSLLTKKIILFALCIVLSLAFYFLFLPSMEKEKEAKKSECEKKELLDFLSSFYHFSTLLNSYWQGFRLAYDNIHLSNLKDRLSDYIENPSTPLDLKITNSRKENLLLDELVRFLHSEEETNREDLKRFHSLLKEYEKEGKKKESGFPSYLLPILLSLPLLILFLLPSLI